MRALLCVEKSSRGFTVYERIHLDINVGRSALEQNFDVKMGRAACVACSAAWN
jgi:hypothetical protein